MTATAFKEDQFKQEQRFNEESEIVKLYKECHDFAFRAWSPYLVEAQKDLACYLGDQWDHQDRAFLASQKRNALVFNRVRRNIKMVTGHERRSRHSIIAQPIENSDEQTANQLTAAMLWLYNKENIHNTNSDAFEASLKTGMNLLQLSVDFSEDPVNGDIKVARVPYNQVLLDPRMTKRDLSDCEFILQRRNLSREAVKALLPFRANDIDLLTGSSADGRFPNMQSLFAGKNKQTLRYDEFWVRKFKPVKVLLDRLSGETREIPVDAAKDARIQQMVALVPELTIIDKQVPTVELHILVEDIVMFSGEDPWKIGDFPHVPVFAFWDPEHSTNNSHFHDGTPGRDDLGHFFSDNHSGDFAIKLQSLVRCMRDPQTEANKRRSKMLDILDSQVNSGWIVEDDAIVNPKSLHRSGQGVVIYTKEGKPIPQKIPSGSFDQSHIALSQMMDNDLVEIPGITEELLGLMEEGQGQISGVLAKLRQGAGLTVLQDIFDNYNLARKLQGKKIIKMIQGNWSAEKVARIINEEPSEEFLNKNFGKYDVSVEEAIETPSQRALAFAQFMQARQAGIPIPDTLIIDYLPIQEKDEVKKAIAEQQQQAQAVQEQELRDKEMLRQLQRSKVFSDVGLGVERIARAEADRGLARERISELQENNAQAILARAKAVSELENLDTDRLIKLVTFVRDLEDRNKLEAEELKQQQEQKVAGDIAGGLGLIKGEQNGQE